MHAGRCHYCGSHVATPQCHFCGAVVVRPVHRHHPRHVRHAGSHHAHATGASLFGELTIPQSITQPIATAVEQAKRGVSDVVTSAEQKARDVQSGITSTISSAQKTFEQTKESIFGSAQAPAAQEEQKKSEPLGIGVYVAGAVAIGALLIIGTQLLEKSEG